MLLKFFLVSAFIISASQGAIHNEASRKRYEPGKPYIMGGDIVQDRFYPSMVSLRENDVHFCAGVILNEWWIMTAAQCLQDVSHYARYAVVGSNLLNSGGEYHKGANIEFHAKYDPVDSWRNDICLLKLYEPIHFTWGTTPARLPTQGQDIPIGTTATVVGWGSEMAGGSLSNELRSLEVKVADLVFCNETYHYYKLNVYDTEICAGGLLGKGTCDGDMGGPLFINDEVVGIVSWGKPCGQQGYPTVYTKVSDYVQWITKTITQ